MTDASFSASKNEGRRRQTPQQVEWVRDASVIYVRAFLGITTTAPPSSPTMEQGLKASPVFIGFDHP